MTGEPLKPCPKPSARWKKPRKPLVRTRMKRKPPRRLKKAGSDPAYLAWVRTLPCAVPFPGLGCKGRMHAHHAGRKPGVALKAPDSTAIPLCDAHHRQWHDASGIFADLTKAERASYADMQIARTQAAWSRA